MFKLLANLIFLCIFIMQNGIAQQCTNSTRGEELMGSLFLSASVKVVETTTVSQNLLENKIVTFQQVVNLDEQSAEVRIETTRNDLLESSSLLKLIGGEYSAQLEGVDVPVTPSKKAILNQALLQQGLLPREYEIIDCEPFQDLPRELTGDERVVIKTRLDGKQKNEVVHIVFSRGQIQGFYVSYSYLGSFGLLVFVEDYILNREDIAESFETEVFLVEDDETTHYGNSFYQLDSYDP